MCLMTVICWNWLTKFVQEEKIPLFFLFPQNTNPGLNLSPPSPTTHELLLVHWVVIMGFFPPWEEGFLPAVFTSSTPGNSSAAWALGVGLCMAWQSPGASPGLGTRCCPSNGQHWKDRGICTSVFPKDALGLKFQPCNFFFMVFSLTLKWMKTESVQTTIIISQWWKWEQWESTLAAKIVMHEEGSGFGCWGTAVVLRPPPEAGAVYHALSLQTADAQQATTVLL